MEPLIPEIHELTPVLVHDIRDCGSDNQSQCLPAQIQLR
jgi:hypothetical protein